MATFLGLIGTAWQASRAWNAEKTALSEARIAKLESANAQAISDFLLKDILAQSDPENQINSNHIADPNIKLRTVLDRASKSVAERFSASPIVEGNIHYTIGQAYMSIGLFDQAEEHLLRTIEIGKNTTGLMEEPGTARAIGTLGQLRIEQDRLNEAEPLIIEAYEILKRLVNEDSGDIRTAQGRLVVLRFEQNRFEEALKLALSLEQQCTKFLGETSLPTLAARHNVADQYSSLGRTREAIEIHQRGLDTTKRLLGPDHPQTLSFMRGLAVCFDSLGKQDEAIKLFESVLESDRKIFGVDHNTTLTDQSQLGHVLQDHSRVDEGEKLLASALEKLTRNLGFDHKITLTAASYLASLLNKRNQHQKAFELRTSIYEAEFKKLGNRHRLTILSKNNLADSLRSLGRKSEAAQQWQEAVTFAIDSLGKENDLTLTVMNNLGSFHQSEGRFKESYELFETVYEKRHKKFGPNEYGTLLGAFNLAYVSNRLGRYADAIVLLEKSLGNMVESLGRDHSLTLRTLTELGELYRLEASIPNRFEKAESLQRQVFESNIRLFGLHHENTRKAMEDVVLAMLKQGKEPNARQFVQQQIDRATAENGGNSIEVVAIEESAGTAFQKESKVDIAITLFGHAYENLKVIQGAAHQDTQRLFEKLVGVLHFNNLLQGRQLCNPSDIGCSEPQ